MTEPTPEQLECVEVVITADSAEWLADFTRSLVTNRLAACGHNIAQIQSIYRWDGKIHDDPQARVALHTRASLADAIVSRTIQEHADTVPCVIAMPIIAGNASYLEWIYSETSSPTLGI